MGVWCSLIYATAEDSGLLECENVLGRVVTDVAKEKNTSTFKIR
jgi:hypothetical protein